MTPDITESTPRSYAWLKDHHLELAHIVNGTGGHWARRAHRSWVSSCSRSRRVSHGTRSLNPRISARSYRITRTRSRNWISACTRTSNHSSNSTSTRRGNRWLTRIISPDTTSVCRESGGAGNLCEGDSWVVGAFKPAKTPIAAILKGCREGSTV